MIWLIVLTVASFCWAVLSALSSYHSPYADHHETRRALLIFVLMFWITVVCVIARHMSHHV